MRLLGKHIKSILTSIFFVPPYHFRSLAVVAQTPNRLCQLLYASSQLCHRFTRASEHHQKPHQHQQQQQLATLQAQRCQVVVAALRADARQKPSRDRPHVQQSYILGMDSTGTDKLRRRTTSRYDKNNNSNNMSL